MEYEKVFAGFMIYNGSTFWMQNRNKSALVNGK